METYKDSLFLRLGTNGFSMNTLHEMTMSSVLYNAKGTINWNEPGISNWWYIDQSGEELWLDAINVDLFILMYIESKKKFANSNNFVMFTTSLISSYLNGFIIYNLGLIEDDRILNVWLRPKMFDVGYLLFPVYYSKQFVLFVVRLTQTKYVFINI